MEIEQESTPSTNAALPAPPPLTLSTTVVQPSPLPPPALSQIQEPRLPPPPINSSVSQQSEDSNHYNNIMIPEVIRPASSDPETDDSSRKRKHDDPSQSQQPEDQTQKALKVEDALTYLDKVKTQFGDQPHIYNKFLDIMKNFKAETIDTPGVIRNVQALFRGHNNLILGFNTFLPPGCRIELSHLPPDGSELMGRSNSGGNMPPGMQEMAAAGMPPQYNHYYYPSATGAAPPGFLPGYLPPGMLPAVAMMAPQMDPQQLQQQDDHNIQGPGQPVEFDQAISYVTKIKRRFQSDPDTYKSFLEILHTYQKEQKSIKEVLDQVSELFRDHSDLLREFTYFLPDNVRDKAKQEIARISARRNKEDQRNRANNMNNNQDKKGGGGERKPRKREAPSGNSNNIQLSSLSLPQQGGLRSSNNNMNSHKMSVDIDEEPLYLEGHIPKLERRLFARIKSALASRERWAEFLKCLHLFSQEVITRAELVALATDIFTSHVELLDELDRLLASRGATENNEEDAWYSMPLSDIDFSQSRRCTPSYRALPASYPKLPCSERTALCRSVLNDTWVSVPTGSEDFSFKSMRKNVYEEALFKCEDDRYEIDMVIDSNMSTIRVLESLNNEIQSPVDGLSNNKAPFHYQLDRRALSVINLKAICRVYGTRGTEILELLSKSPATAIPVILVRLKQKDDEWRRQRIELNKEWKEVLERNYHKSLDHRSFYFKQNEKKTLAQKSLLGEIKDSPDKKMILPFPDAFAHRNAASLISLWAEKNLMRSEAEKLVATLDRFVAGFKATRPKEKRVNEFRPAVGTRVFTRYGSGVVSALVNGECQVKLDKDTQVLVPLTEAVEDCAPDSEKWEFNVCVGASGYTFLRIYHVLCQRLTQADGLCQTVDREPAKTAVKHVVERSVPDAEKDAGAGERFSALMQSIRQLLSGGLDANKFEEDCCTLLGSGSFFIFTVDKLVGLCARAIQAMAQDERAAKVNEAILSYKLVKSAANASNLYRAESEALAAGSAASVVVKLIPGTKPVFKLLNPEDPLWEVAPRLELTFLDAISYPVRTPNGFNPPRTQSPVPASAAGDIVEMGEIDVCIPWRIKLKPSSVGANNAGEEVSKKSSSRLEEKASEVVVVTGVYVQERLPGSDDVFKRIAASGGLDAEVPWWKAETALAGAMDVEEQEEEEEEGGGGGGAAATGSGGEGGGKE